MADQPHHTTLPNEAQLLEALSRGSSDAFRILFKYYQPRLYLSILPFAESADTAEEMVQEVLFKLWARRETLLGIVSLERYLLRSAKNQFLDYIKKENREQGHRKKRGLPKADTSTAVDELEFREYMQAAQTAIDLLPERQREVFLMRHQGDMTTEQIAAAIGSNPGAVRKNLARAVHFIKAQLQENSDWFGIVFLFITQTKK